MGPRKHSRPRYCWLMVCHVQELEIEDSHDPGVEQNRTLGNSQSDVENESGRKSFRHCCRSFQSGSPIRARLSFLTLKSPLMTASMFRV